MVKRPAIVREIAFPDGIATGELKAKIRAGELDGYYDQFKVELDRQRAEYAESQRIKQKEKSDRWKERNLPKLQRQASLRRMREQAERAEKAERAKAYKKASEVPVSERNYLDVPFSRKDEAKAAGAFWDADRKKWFAVEMNDKLQEFAPKSAAQAVTAPPPKAPAPTRRAPISPPKSGYIDEDDPSLWGSELLGYEGESWQRFYATEAGERFMKKYRGTANDER